MPRLTATLLAICCFLGLAAAPASAQVVYYYYGSPGVLPAPRVTAATYPRYAVTVAPSATSYRGAGCACPPDCECAGMGGGVCRCMNAIPPMPTHLIERPSPSSAITYRYAPAPSLLPPRLVERRLFVPAGASYSVPAPRYYSSPSYYPSSAAPMRPAYMPSVSGGGSSSSGNCAGGSCPPGG